MDPHVALLKQKVEALQRDFDFLRVQIEMSTSLVDLKDKIMSYPWESKP